MGGEGRYVGLWGGTWGGGGLGTWGVVFLGGGAGYVVKWDQTFSN